MKLWLWFGLVIVGGYAGAWVFSRKWRSDSSRELRVILTGGGTGGHVNPALAIAEGIRSRAPESRFLYVGVTGKAESVIVRKAGYPLRFVVSEGFPGLRLKLRTLRFFIKLGIGTVQSLFILFGFAPRWIVATGGYVSAPIILAGLLLRALRLAPVKIFLHEQNSIPGQLNAFLGRWTDRVLLTFPPTLSFFPHNGVVVGYPIRHSIVLKPRAEVLPNLPFVIPEGRQVVFAFGGSQGARTINRAIVDSLRHFLPYRERVFIIHGMGLARSPDYDASADTEARFGATYSEAEQVAIGDFYYRQDYFHNIADIYSIADLVVCRSGAGSLNEMSRLGKPSLLIPKANLPGDHQVMNARAMKYAGAAEILFEDTVVEEGAVLEKVGGKVLAERIMRLLDSPAKLDEMAAKSGAFLRRHSNERILSEVFADRAYNNGIGVQSSPLQPLINNARLLAVLSAAYGKDLHGYNPLSIIGDEDDLSYYQHRAAALLSSEEWQVRNLGVKLVGYTRYLDKIPALLHMLHDRTPAHWLQRLFGGDYRQVGFIRRNIVHALQVMNQYNGEIEGHLLRAIEDPYFEVRAQVCRASGHFGSLLAGKEVWMQALTGALQDRSFEVVMEAARALGEVGVDGRALDLLCGLRENHYWQVRDAALHAINRLLERHVIAPSADFLPRVAGFILTSTDFRPHFSIKERYKAIECCCKRQHDNGKLPADNGG